MEALPPFLNKALAILLLKWHGIGLSLASFFYGLRLYLNHVLLSQEGTYDKLYDIVDLRIIALLFMTLGTVKFIGIVANLKKFRVVGVISLAVLWTVIGFTFLPTPNTIAVISLGYAWTSFGIILREDFK